MTMSFSTFSSVRNNAESGKSSRQPFSIQNVSIVIGAFAFVTGILVAFASNVFAEESADSLKTIVFQENETPAFLLKQAQAGDAEAMFKYSTRCKDTKESIKWLEKSAQSGYARAQFYLGLSYSEGFSGVEINPDLAKEWLTKATKNKFPLAKVYRYYKGIGLEQSQTKALKVLKRSAKAGYAESQLFLSNVYNGDGPFIFEGIKKSEARSIYWLKKSAENGFEPAQTDLGLALIHKEKTEEGIKWLKKAANQGSAYAQHTLAHYYYFGTGVEKNLPEAAKWAKKAADQGDELGKSLLDLIKLQYPQADSVDEIEEARPEADAVPANSDLSLKTIVFKEYETIDYLKKKAEAGDAEAMFKFATKTASVSDENEYVKWLIKSAKNGYARAQFYVGLMYLEGHANTEVNPELAKKWLTSASDKGFPIAKVYCFYKGIGVEEDKDKAWKELVRSANDGYVESQMMLFDVYSGAPLIRFDGINSSEEKAQYWLEKAAENGFLPAQQILAMMYERQEKFAESFKWLKKAALQGDVSSLFSLIRAYCEGENVEKDLTEAKKWAQKAADEGYESAKQLLDNIKKQLSDASPVEEVEEAKLEEAEPAEIIEEEQFEEDSFEDDLDEEDDLFL